MAYLAWGQQVVLPEKGVRAGRQTPQTGTRAARCAVRGGPRGAGARPPSGPASRPPPSPTSKSIQGRGFPGGDSAQWRLPGRSRLYSCEADGEELTLPTRPLPRPPPAGLAHTLTRSAPLEPGQAGPAACWLLPPRLGSSKQGGPPAQSRAGSTCRVSRRSCPDPEVTGEAGESGFCSRGPVLPLLQTGQVMCGTPLAAPLTEGKTEVPARHQPQRVCPEMQRPKQVRG